MATGSEQQPPGILYKDANREFSASEKAINAALASAEKLGSKALDWSGDHPVQFVALLICLIIIVFIRGRSRVEVTRMQQEYESKREQVRKYQQQPLPLPPPEPPETGRSS